MKRWTILTGILIVTTNPKLPGDTLSFSIKDPADLTLAIMKVGQSGLLKDASSLDQSLLKTMISELGTNIIKYAKRGVISVKRVESGGATDILILAQDAGPGIPNVELAMQDRFSTGTSLGLGLPGVKRMADVFSIHSSALKGTSVSAQKRIRGRFYSSEARESHDETNTARQFIAKPVESLRCAHFDVSSYTRPMPGEVLSGDMAAIIELADGVLIALVDVSGHGAQASALANEIRQFLATHATSQLSDLMSLLHDRLKGTRGAAISLLFLDVRGSTIQYCGVGNTGAYRVVGQTWRPISKDGVLGHRLPTLTEDGTKLSNGDLILVWTDGVSELAAKNFVSKHAYRPSASLARELVTALGRPFDDAGCVVLKWVA